MNLTPKQTIKGTVAVTQSLRGSMKDIPSLDNTLTKEGYAADAKAVGKALNTKAPISHTEDKGNPHGVTASQVGARPDTWMPSASEIGARPDTWMPTANDVGARPNTWMPTASDVGAATPDHVKKASPFNLLDNSDFRNPVNQRGKTSYTDAGYSIDRWMVETSNVTLAISNGYITVTMGTGYGGIIQNLENYDRLKSKVATIAVNIDGAIYVQHFEIGGLAGGLRFGNTAITFYSIDGANILFRIGENSSVNIYWVALYEGEYTAETLPEYHPKGYGVELEECQRYYQQDLTTTYTVTGMFDGSGCIDVMVPLPTTMRIIPTVNCIAYASGVAQGDNTIRIAVENIDTQTVPCTYQWRSANIISARYINGAYAWKKAIVTFRYTASADL